MFDRASSGAPALVSGWASSCVFARLWWLCRPKAEFLQ